MFTPQPRKQWSASTSGKGKSTVATAVRSNAWSRQDWTAAEEEGADEAVVWRRFREAGMLDEAELQRKDREGLLQRISELEKELCEYQHNMGLILIEKNDCSAKIEELMQSLEEVEEILKREQSARLIATSEFERREENLKKALALEKQCVADLEKALREVQSEIDGVKSNSNKKLEEAKSLEASLENKKIETERKLHQAEARLAEASRKCTQADRKLEDAEMMEKKLHKEKLLFDTERQLLEKNLSEKEASLLAWERKLEETQRRQFDRQESLNEREDRINEREWSWTKKQEELEEMKRQTEATSNSVKAKEEDVDKRLQDLSEKEKALESRINSQEIKERAFVVREEKISHRELELERKMHKLKELEADLDAKSRVLKNWEASAKEDEKKIKADHEKLDEDLKDFSALRSELEILKKSLEEEKLQILRDEERLRVTHEEKERHSMLTTQLEQEIDKQRSLNFSLSKELEELRLQKESFEREWELLDDKRNALNEERENLEREFRTKEENLNMKFEGESSKFDELLRNREKELQQLERTIQGQKESEERQIESLRASILNEKELILIDKEKLKSDRLELAKDIDNLRALSSQIKNQREELIRDKNCFYTLAGEYKSCKSCGVEIFNDSELQFPRSEPAKKLAITPEAGPSGARSSFVQKCSALFNLSPGKKDEEIPASEDVDKVEKEISEGNVISENVEQSGERTSQQKRKGRRGKLVKRTHSVMDVMKESKGITGEDIEESKGRKRRLKESVIEESEGYSESASLGGGRRKRHQTVGSIVQTPGEKRYNFRRTTIAASQATKEESKGFEHSKPTESELRSSGGDGEGIEISKPDNANEVQQTVLNNVMQPDVEATTHEKSEEEIVVVEEKMVLDGLPETAVEGSELATPTVSGEESEEDEEDEVNKPITKKIWDFLIS
ncbi:hypothetical protein LUZ62_067741 [Rhynchospora pubera]|uniref:Uncharacterized protein n=1 Tax=Rhynchospora pubera TaxID=906938 RepID=A0AAV8CQ84_9POAL|nr:hypothetical protein LUZ62_067741 [Rhynchospora pubera]